MQPNCIHKVLLTGTCILLRNDPMAIFKTSTFVLCIFRYTLKVSCSFVCTKRKRLLILIRLLFTFQSNNIRELFNLMNFLDQEKWQVQYSTAIQNQQIQRYSFIMLVLIF